MNASKLLAGAVVTVSVLGSLGGLAHAQSTGTGTAPSGGMQRSEMGQSQNPGATTSTDPSTLQTNPRWNPSSDSTMQRPDGSIVSKPLEDLFPFLDREEFRSNMLIPTLED